MPRLQPRRSRLASPLVLALAPGFLAAQDPSLPDAAVADNSFFIEEGYNQEPGVVQHISTFTAAGRSNRDLSYTLTQEWPFRGQRHQLSYTVPVVRPSGGGGGLGDVLLNYRLQVGAGSRRWALAPRLSLVLPTGSVTQGRGDGSLGVQANLPFSYQLSRAVVTHWNAGLTHLPGAQGLVQTGGRVRRTLTDYHLGGSIVAPAHLPLQLLLESVVTFESEITGTGRVDRSAVWIASPGVRGAVNLGGVQIVPGFALPVAWTRGEADSDLFFYLSLEHRFQ